MNVGGKFSTFLKSLKSLKPDFHRKSRRKNAKTQNDDEPGTSKEVKEIACVVDTEDGTRLMTERANKKVTTELTKADNDGVSKDEDVLEKQYCNNLTSAKRINNHIEKKSLQPTTEGKLDGVLEIVSESKRTQEVNNCSPNLTDSHSTSSPINKQNDIEINVANKKTSDYHNIRSPKSDDLSDITVPDIKLNQNKGNLDKEDRIEVTDSLDGKKEIVNLTGIERKEIKVLEDKPAKTNVSLSTPSHTEQDDEQETKLTLDNLANIVREVEEIEKTIKNLADNKDEFHHIEQTIIDYLIKLDKIPSRNSKLIRDERRKCIKYVQGVMTVLDDIIKKGQGSKIN